MERVLHYVEDLEGQKCIFHLGESFWIKYILTLYSGIHYSYEPPKNVLAPILWRTFCLEPWGKVSHATKSI